MSSEPEVEPPSRAYQLPALLAEIAEAAGLPAAMAIAQVKGGGRAHFPASCADDHWLVAAVGREAADKVCELFRVNHRGGINLTVPLGPTRLYDRARFRALEMLDRGQSIRETAREIGVSTRAVEIWRAAEVKRRAVYRKSRNVIGKGGGVLLSRAYDPMKDGLVASLGEALPGTGRRASVEPSAGSNVPPPPPVDVGALPGILAEMSEVVGVGAAVVVGYVKSSRVLHLTDDAGRGDDLLRLAGPVSGPRLDAHFRAKHGGAVEVLMPFCPHEAFTTVASWTAAARDDGHAAADVAGWLGLTPAIVDHLCAYTCATVGSGFNFRGSFPYFDPSAEG